MKKFIFYLALLTLTAILSSCASVTPSPVSMPSLPEVRREIVHTVAPGETLWRISKMYNVPIASIVQANHLKTTDSLKMGQRLTIPNATRPQPVISLYPSKKWKYIIIHHSATRLGNSLAFHKAHLRKGWDRGVGYHFIIDRRTSGKQDGQIETTPRWLKQQDGSHCKASNMNTKAIGICLVGDFNQGYVSPKQMESLVYLVNTLKNYYKIPSKNILAHGHVEGATTACPGRKFPWQDFKDRLRPDSASLR